MGLVGKDNIVTWAVTAVLAAAHWVLERKSVLLPYLFSRLKACIAPNVLCA